MIEKIKSENWLRCEDSKKCAQQLGAEISKALEIFDAHQILLFISGGSCLSVADFIESKDFSDVTLAMLDERYDQTNENNNFSQLEKLSWSKKFLKKGGKFIATKVLQNESQEKLAERFTAGVENWEKKNPKGKMVALFGMGTDGHTAGIFPFEDENFFQNKFEGNDVVISYDAKGKNKFEKRITTTGKLFEKFEIAFAYVCGEDKKAALLEFKKGNEKSNELPFMLIRKAKKILIASDINFDN